MFVAVPGCEDKIACSSGEGCYSSSQRCDSLSDCLDSSDESMCPSELCVLMHDRRQCHNGRCLLARLWCDGTDDCGDNSDEEACLKVRHLVIIQFSYYYLRRITGPGLNLWTLWTYCKVLKDIRVRKQKRGEPIIVLYGSCCF